MIGQDQRKAAIERDLPFKNRNLEKIKKSVDVAAFCKCFFLYLSGVCVKKLMNLIKFYSSCEGNQDFAIPWFGNCVLLFINMRYRDLGNLQCE